MSGWRYAVCSAIVWLGVAIMACLLLACSLLAGAIAAWEFLRDNAASILRETRDELQRLREGGHR